MKIKALFISLLLSCGVQTIAYGQQSEGNSEFRIQNSEFCVTRRDMMAEKTFFVCQ